MDNDDVKRGSLLDRWRESSPHLQLKVPLCHQCKHYLEGTTRCVAFPDGIPDPILAGDLEHTEPYPTDNGIQFEEKP